MPTDDQWTERVLLITRISLSAVVLVIAALGMFFVGEGCWPYITISSLLGYWFR